MDDRFIFEYADTTPPTSPVLSPASQATENLEGVPVEPVSPAVAPVLESPSVPTLEIPTIPSYESAPVPTQETPPTSDSDDDLAEAIRNNIVHIFSQVLDDPNLTHIQKSAKIVADCKSFIDHTYQSYAQQVRDFQ